MEHELWASEQMCNPLCRFYNQRAAGTNRGKMLSVARRSEKGTGGEGNVRRFVELTALYATPIAALLLDTSQLVCTSLPR